MRYLAFLPSAILYGAFTVCGLWAYAMKRAQDSDQYRFAVYAYTFGQLASAAGAAALLLTA